MIRVLIVDDEAPARAQLARLLASMRDVELVGEADDGEAAVDRITALVPDLVLLDIKMPRLDGFGVVQALGDDMPLTIFCTAYDEFALAAFDAHAIGYLLKPVQSQRLAAAMHRAAALLTGVPTARRRGMRAVTELVESTAPFLTRLLVYEADRALLLPVERIDHIRAERNYCDVRSGGRTFRVRRTLSALAARLDPKGFLRINKSDVVRLDAIDEIQPWSHGDYRVVLHDGTSLSWSRRYRAAASTG